MATRQDELRRLMKESKAQSAQTDKRASAAKRTGGGVASSTAASATSDDKNVHAKSNGPASADAGKAIPAGFFDDSLADAKARNVDVKQLAETQLNQDWEQFQEFVAEVEQQDVKESELQKEEAKEREAVEQLENMQYVDRYRIALERAAKLGAAKKEGSKKRGLAPEEEEEPEATVNTAKSGGDADAGEEHAVANAVQNHMKKLKTAKKQKKKKAESSDEDDDEAFDPCNWRSKAF